MASSAEPSESSAVGQEAFYLAEPIRILIAEDDKDIRYSLTALFDSIGYQVTEAQDGCEFLDQLAPFILATANDSPPDVILTDVRMPGFDVLNIIEGLRQMGWRIPIFVFSAFADSAMYQRVKQVGVTKFFHKPLDFDQLEQAVRLVTWNAQRD